MVINPEEQLRAVSEGGCKPASFHLNVDCLPLASRVSWSVPWS